MIVTYQLGNLFSAAVAGGGIICYQQPKPIAAAAIATAVDGVTLARANALLDKPVSGPAWKATFSGAVAADLQSLNDEVASLADRDRADQLAAKLASLGEMLAEIHQQQAEANRLASEANQIAASEAAEVKQQQAVAKQAAAAREDAAKWIDIRVVQEGDEIVVWKDVREFTHTEGPKHLPQFRTYSKLIARHPVSQCPPEVLARVGMPVVRSKTYIPDSAR